MITLFPGHRAELHASGLTDETIERAGIYSEADQRKLQHLLGWAKPPKKMGAAIVFPYHAPDGTNGYARLKPDNKRKREGKPVKYESPKGRPNEVYFPPGTVAVVDDPAIPLLITEGEKKALCADQNGVPCIGLVGVWGWKPKKQERLLPGIERIEWKGRKVYVCFDSDREDKPDVQGAESRLAAVLTRYGAIVRCIRLPSRPDGAKVGLDDFVVGNGVNELHRLIAEAAEPDPVDAGEGQRLACALEPRDEVEKMLAHDAIDGVPRLRYWRGTFWWWANGRYIEQEADEVQSQIVTYLNPTVQGLNTGIVGNHLMQVKAQARIPSGAEPPSWLGEPGWAPSEMLACKNTLVHLPSYLAGRGDYHRTATPRYFATSAMKFDFNPDAGTPEKWFAFLRQLWPTDFDAIDLLREWIGYLLTADTSQQRILLMLGPRRAGKGTIARVIAALLGNENVAWPSMQVLGRPFGGQGLIGKTLAVVGDAKVAGRDEATTATARLLGISGEDEQENDRKGKPSITCRLPTRLMILSNEIPRLPDPSGALDSRYLILRFTETFAGREDRELEKKLLAELPAILLWAITGWHRLRERGQFHEPESAAEIHEQVADLGSPVGRFVREKCVTENHASWIVREDLYEAFKAWAKESGRDRWPDNAEFGRQLRAAVPSLLVPKAPRHVKDSAGKDCKKRVYQGIELAPESF